MPGRPRAILDRELIERLAGADCSIEEIAAFTGVSRDTIERRARDSIKFGALKGKVALRLKQRQLAMQGNVTMLIWLGKQCLGQTDQPSQGSVDAQAVGAAIRAAVGLIREADGVAPDTA